MIGAANPDKLPPTLLVAQAGLAASGALEAGGAGGPLSPSKGGKEGGGGKATKAAKAAPVSDEEFRQGGGLASVLDVIKVCVARGGIWCNV